MTWKGIERGEVLLPAKDVPKLRAALNAAHNPHVDRVRFEVMELWTQTLRPLTGKSREVYMRPMTGVYATTHASTTPIEVRNDVHRLFAGTMSRPSEVLYESHGLSYGTNRTTAWRSHTAVARLERRTLHWESRPTCQDGDDPFSQWLAPALFEFLEKIEWTRGSGGQIIGSDSLNDEMSFTCDPVEYTLAEFGPGKDNTHARSGTCCDDGWAPRLVLPT